MGLGVGCTKMEEQLLLLNPFVENITQRKKRLGEPIFLRKKEVW
jgi:hypothetical protein